MRNILKNKYGMNIVGQGGKIILFMLPSLIAAILIHIFLPKIAVLPENFSIIKPVGYFLLFIGLLFWGTAVIQLMLGFTKNKLVTTGAYSIVRAPIYSSATFFILPAITLITLSWVYIIVSVFLFIGVMIFIGKEEQQLIKVFGKEYENYKESVNRIVPLIKFKRLDLSLAYPQKLTMENKIMLICGILASSLFIITDIVAGLKWEGYSFISQSISELSAIGAPTRTLVVPLNIIKELLTFVFGLGVLRMAFKSISLRIIGICISFNSILGLVVVFFPMRVGEMASLTNIILIGSSMLFLLIAIGFGAAAFKNWFRFFSIGILVYFFILTIIGLFVVPKISIGSVPTVGIQERNMVYLCLFWVIMLSIVLLRTGKSKQ